MLHETTHVARPIECSLAKKVPSYQNSRVREHFVVIDILDKLFLNAAALSLQLCAALLGAVALPISYYLCLMS